MKNLLDKFKHNREVISIYQSDLAKCWAGFVYDIDDDYVLLSHITDDGFYGGFILLSIDTITNIEHSTISERKLYKLYELRKQQPPCIKLSKKDTLLTSVLEYSHNEQAVISIYFDKDDEYTITGVIYDISEEDLCIQIYNKVGAKNGFSHIKKYDICQIFVDGLYEQNISLLSKNDFK